MSPFALPEPLDRPPRVGGDRAEIEVVVWFVGGIGIGQVDRGRMIVVGREGMVVDRSVGSQIGKREIHGAQPPRGVDGRSVNSSSKESLTPRRQVAKKTRRSVSRSPNHRADAVVSKVLGALAPLREIPLIVFTLSK
jgi:hypothetical protein